MHRFYIPPAEWSASALALRGSEAHHCRNVLRMEPGEEITIFNGHGVEATAEITSLAAGKVELRLVAQRGTPPVGCRITLAQAIPKGKNMELIVQKAVELGAAAIAPLITERTVVHLDERGAAQKQAKWQAIAVEAAKQCGQNWLPHVHTPRSLEAFFATALQFDLSLIGSLEPDAVHLKTVLARYSAQHNQPRATVLMLVGPEGDFTPDEYARAREHGCVGISLGSITLRVETAAIYCLSVLSYELLTQR
jgi:16S rRNA (uracil1498-N3)-methyltransferase